MASLSRVTDVIVVHAVPLIRLGVASIVMDSENLSGVSISTFSTFADATNKIEHARRGDIAILDVSSWLAITNLLNQSAFQDLKTDGPAFGVIATKAQLKINRLSFDGLSELVTIDAEIADIKTMIENLILGRRPAFQHRVNNLGNLLQLTDKQVKILELIARGCSNREIASELGIQEGTVKSHTSKVFKKLNCHQRTEAMRVFLEASNVGPKLLETAQTYQQIAKKIFRATSNPRQ